MEHILTEDSYEMIVDYSVAGSLKSFKEEVLEELYRVHQQQGEMPLLFSGGMDSTFILRCMQELGVNVRTVSFSFTKDNSDYDCELVKRKCKKYGLSDPEFFYMDEDKFYDHLYFLVNERNVVYPMLHGFFMDHFLTENPSEKFYTGMQGEFKLSKGNIVMPAGPIMVKRNFPNTLYCFTTDRTFLSYFKHPAFVNNFRKQNPYLRGFNEDRWFIRDLIYQDCFPDMEKEDKLIDNNWRNYIKNFYYNSVQPVLALKKSAMIQPCYFSAEFLVNLVNY